MVLSPEHPPLTAGSSRVTSSAIRELLAAARVPGLISLAGGIPDAGLLPTDDLAPALARAAEVSDSFQYGPTQGEPALREWIARHELDGADPDRVVVTQGAQQALSLVVAALVEPGRDAVVEAASYVGMLQPLRRAGARLHAVDGDRDGMSTSELSRLLGRGVRPALVYVVPTHQNPTGAVMSAPRRRHLGLLATAHRTVVVDDDPYRRLGPPPPPRLRQHLPDELAVTVGSFSKSIAPGLRVGWLHGPDWLVDAVVRLKQSDDLHTGSLAQRVVLELVSRDGWLVEHCARLAEAYRRRAATLVEALQEELGDVVTVEAPRGGMFTWAEFDPELGGTDRLAAAALEEGVAVVPGSAFDPWGRPGDGARLGIASVGEADLVEGARRLARAVRRGAPPAVAASAGSGTGGGG